MIARTEVEWSTVATAISAQPMLRIGVLGAKNGGQKAAYALPLKGGGLGWGSTMRGLRLWRGCLTPTRLLRVAKQSTSPFQGEGEPASRALLLSSSHFG